MPNQPEVQVSLSLDTQPFHQGLSEVERAAQQTAQRMGAAGQSATGFVQPPLSGQPAPLPGSQAPTHPVAPAPIASAYEELERIRATAAVSPEIAMASLRGASGQGGLQSRVMKAAVGDPDNADQYQQLLNAIRDLTKSLHGNTETQSEGKREGAGLMAMIRQNAMTQTAGMVGQNLIHGNVLGAGGALVGGLLGGPAGAMAGQAIAGTVGSVINIGQENLEYDKLTADVAARFGNFGEEDQLKVGNIDQFTAQGFKGEESAKLLDSLRRARVIDGVDEEAKELTKSIQELTRATGEQTEVIVQQYGNYRTTGGDMDAEQYMGTMIAGAVSAGMRSNLQEYGEMVGSARGQLVYGSGMRDENDAALLGVQRTLTGLMGSGSKTGDLLQDNPMLAQQMLSSFLSTGSAKAYSYDSSAMQLAGINRAHTTEGFVSPERQMQNAIARQQHALNNVLGQGMGAMGFGSMAELQAAAAADPNLVQNLFTDKNPNTQQSAALQDMLNMQLTAQYGRDPTAQERTMSLQFLQTYLQTGALDPNQKSEGGKSIGELIKESQMTEGEKARKADTDRHKEMMKLGEEMKGALLAISQAATEMLKLLNDFVPIAKSALSAISGAIQSIANPQQAVTNAANTAADVGAEGVAAVAEKLGMAKTDEDKAKVKATAKQINSGILSNAGKVAGQIFLPGASATVLDWLGTGSKPTIEGSAELSKSAIPSLDGIAKDGFFNDTPLEGVVSRPGFDTFQFAHGDRVFANRTDPGGGGQGGGMPPIFVTINVANGDPEVVSRAAQDGIRSGHDEFVERWHGRSINEPRVNTPLY